MTSIANARRQIARASTGFEDAPGLFEALSKSMAALNGYLGMRRALDDGRLTGVERRLIGLMVAQRCTGAYWLSVQVAQARAAGLTTAEIADAREGYAASERRRGLLFLASKLVINHGELSDADLAAARQTGLAEADIVETVAHVAFNMTAAFVAHGSKLPLDHPPAPPLQGF